MLTILISVGLGSIGAIISYMTYREYTEKNTTNKIEHIKDIQNVVMYIQNIARKKPTDDILDNLVNDLLKNPITENCLIRISALHKQYGNNLGREGYAINVLWSAIVCWNHECILYKDKM